MKSKQADRRVTISTINSVKEKLRRIHTLTIGPGLNLDAIIIPKLRLRLHTLEIPEVWEDLDAEWADQDTYGVPAQILLGAD